MITYSEQKGAFIKHCPCTPGVVPCGYYNINLHTGCPFHCSYCILQAYLETPEPVFFTNLPQLERELAEASQSLKYLRIGTGELSDSLALDPQTGYSHKLLTIFEHYPGIIFEFKTKSTCIENILTYPKVLKNIVISWSLNPPEIIQREERATPHLESRLQAMKQILQKGYKIGIHFDPLLIFKGWQQAYRQLVIAITKEIPAAAIAWWSLGALRFPYELRDHIFKHTDSRLFEGELIKGHDGKYRYYRPLRLELFHFVRKQIQENISSDLPLYLCMEDCEVWAEIFPQFTAEEEAVNRRLYESVLG